MCGAGPFLSNDPAPFAGACAARVRRRTGISRACSARRDGHWAAGSGVHRSNVDGGGRSGNDNATGAALHSVRSGVGPDYEVVLGAVDRPSFGAPTGGTRGVQHRRWESLVAGDPSTSRSGARTFAGSPATWRLLSLRGWGEIHESRRDRQLYGVEVTGISVRRLRRQEIATSGGAAATQPAARQIWQGPMPEKAPWTRFRRGQGARVRPATRCTALHGVANGLSTPGNGPGNPAHDWPAEHANHGSDGVARCVPPTAATRYQRCLPARRACRAAPTLPAGASGPEPDPPNRPPAVPTRTRPASDGMSSVGGSTRGPSCASSTYKAWG